MPFEQLSTVVADAEGTEVGTHPGARSGWSWHRAAPDRVLVVSDRDPRVGTRSLRMRRAVGDIYAGGQRCEVHHSTGDRERHGTEAWYGLAFMVPAPGGTDPAWEPGRDYALVWQVHQAANTGSPPLALMVSRNWDAANAIHLSFQIIGGAGGQANTRALTLTPPRGAADIRGRWWEVRLHVGWSEQPDGWVEAWARTADDTDWPHHARIDRIRTWLTGDPGGYRKFGLYFGGADREQTVYHHGYIRGTRAEVDGWLGRFAGAPEPEPTPEEPEPAPNPPRISRELDAAIRQAVTHRMTQQIKRAQTLSGPEYVGALREKGLHGLADALERHGARAISANAELLMDEIAGLLADAEVI